MGRAVPRALLLLLAAAGVSPAVAQEEVRGDRYANPRYGIEIVKPPAWYFITAGMIVDLARRTAGGPLPGSEDPVRFAGFAVIVSREPTLGREVRPHVVVLVHELREPPADLLRACEGLRTGLSDAELVEPTRQVELGGRPAARLELMGSVDGIPIRARALCAVRDHRAFVVVAQALPGEFDAEAATFDGILASFRLR